MTEPDNYRLPGRPWQRRPIVLTVSTALFLLVLATAATAGDIAVLAGTSSTSDPAELRYVQNCTRLVTGWLDATGLRYDLIEDGNLSQHAIGSRRVIILPYNPTIPARRFAVLEQFVRRGGRLIVFYSSDARLADLLGMRLGEYKLESYAGQWSRIEFLSTAPAGMPSAVGQHSRNIRPVYPRRKDARVIARWKDRQGKTQPDPAWVASPSGAWMTHILIEGDSVRKQQLLLYMIAHFHPPVLRDAATHAVHALGQVGPYRGYADFMKTIRATPMPRDTRAAIAPRLEKMDALRADIQKQLEAGRFVEVLRTADTLESGIIDAHARAQPSRPGEIRSLWEHSGLGLHPGDWKRTIRTVRNAGFTDLLTNMLWPGEAQFPSTVTPVSEAVPQYGDQLEQCLAAARKSGVRIHLWKVCWSLEHAPENMVRTLKKEDRLQRTHTGEAVNWLCPSHPANRHMEIESIADAVRRYPVDGLHLDYIRYKNSGTCYCNTCRRRFEERLGRRVRSWPRDAYSGDFKTEYRAYRREVITTFVRLVRAVVQPLRPDATISAAVYGSFPSCRDSIGQDWGAWMSSGEVDRVYPMNYLQQNSQFTKYLGNQMKLPGAKAAVHPGIGVTARESRLDAMQTIEQIQAARKAGAQGFALYELNDVLKEEILPVLRLGTTRE